MDRADANTPHTTDAGFGICEGRLVCWYRSHGTLLCALAAADAGLPCLRLQRNAPVLPIGRIAGHIYMVHCGILFDSFFDLMPKLLQRLQVLLQQIAA